jgi:DNA polymerase-3 subunit alpha
MGAKAVVKDVGRVLKVPFDEVDRITKLIPGTPGTTLKDSIEKNSELKTLVRTATDTAVS